MDEPIVTFGLWMGLEVESRQDTRVGESINNALLVYCPTGESEEGKIDDTPQMTDLALMGFSPVAIIRGNPVDIREYVILSKENLSAALKNAVLEEAARIIRKTSEGSDFSFTNNSY